MRGLSPFSSAISPLNVALSALEHPMSGSPSLVLPSYPISGNLAPTQVPTYSRNLRQGEVLLQRSPPGRRRSTSDYVRKCGRETLILHDQLDSRADPDAPQYGPGAQMTGTVLVEQPESVLSVVVQIRGRIEAALRLRGCVTLVTVRETQKLWPASASAAQGDASVCPMRLPFLFVLPARFQRAERHAMYDLPPTYEVSLPGLSAKSGYHVVVVVTRKDHLHHLHVSNKTMSVPFMYDIASHLRSPSMDGKVESGREVVIPIPSCKSEPLSVKLLLSERPRSIFRVEVRLTTRSELLQRLLGVRIECTVQREIGVDLHGRPTARRATLAEAVPLRLVDAPSSGGGLMAEGLVWMGEIRCSAVIPPFDAGLVRVRDYLVVHLTPPPAFAAQYKSVVQSIPLWE
ncbi:unnamed protein product [Mycena citricolor]|uniref:Uncharacterized protein n=1 Tax=Mycena citricolor TaxID=2018698 RepID=A0AAD2HE15_9AGAR|nr:unnamed protein product [Mycena citricolor]